MSGVRTVERVRLGGLWWLLAIALPVWSAVPEEDIAVRVEKDGSEIVVDVDCPVHAPLAVVWDVLTDYDHMTRYISNLQYSAVQRRVGNVLIVRQKGKATRGPFSFAFDNVRAVDLRPYSEIRSQLVSGTLEASTFSTRVIDTGDSVHIVNSGRYTPNVWVPPLIGPALIAAETRKQFEEIRAEIMRRGIRPSVTPTLPP